MAFELNLAGMLRTSYKKQYKVFRSTDWQQKNSRHRREFNGFLKISGGKSGALAKKQTNLMTSKIYIIIYCFYIYFTVFRTLPTGAWNNDLADFSGVLKANVPIALNCPSGQKN